MVLIVFYQPVCPVLPIPPKTCQYENMPVASRWLWSLLLFHEVYACAVLSFFSPLLHWYFLHLPPLWRGVMLGRPLVRKHAAGNFSRPVSERTTVMRVWFLGLIELTCKVNIRDGCCQKNEGKLAGVMEMLLTGAWWGGCLQFPTWNAKLSLGQINFASAN